MSKLRFNLRDMGVKGKPINVRHLAAILNEMIMQGYANHIIGVTGVDHQEVTGTIDVVEPR